MITICGPIKKMQTINSFAGFLKEGGRYESWVNVPDDREFESCSKLIQCRADYLNKISGSRIAIIVCENKYPWPRLILPRHPTYDLIRDVSDVLSQALQMYIWEIEKPYLDRDRPFSIKTIRECVGDFCIGQSTSYEMMWALKSNVPVLLLSDDNINEYLDTRDPFLICPDSDHTFACGDF